MKITFFGGPWRHEEVCYGDFYSIEKLISAGYIVTNVEAA